MFDDASMCWQKVINVLHPILVVCLVLLGYVIQYAACFRRDSAIQSEVSLSTVEEFTGVSKS